MAVALVAFRVKLKPETRKLALLCAAKKTVSSNKQTNPLSVAQPKLK